jgi:hypothetical protein
VKSLVLNVYHPQNFERFRIMSSHFGDSKGFLIDFTIQNQFVRLCLKSFEISLFPLDCTNENYIFLSALKWMCIVLWPELDSIQEDFLIYRKPNFQRNVCYDSSSSSYEISWTREKKQIIFFHSFIVDSDYKNWTSWFLPTTSFKENICAYVLREKY